MKVCYGRNIQDPRHSGIVLQAQTQLPSRLMPDWSMGLVETERGGPATVSNGLELFHLSRPGTCFSEPHALVPLLELFCAQAKLRAL